MKRQFLLTRLLLLFALIVGSGNSWAQTNERTITISYDSSFSPALPSSSSGVNKSSTSHTVVGLAIKEQSIYKGSSNNYLMFVKNAGFLYNTADLGTVNSVAVTYSSGTSTEGKTGVYFGTSEQSTYTTSSNATIKGQSGTDTWTNSTSGKGYFQLSTSNKNVQITQIVIKYTPPAAPSFDVSAGTFNAAFDLTITAATGRTLKYTTDGSDPYSSNTATAVNSNTTTISIPAEDTRVRAISIKDNITSLEADATYTYVDASAPDAALSTTALAFGDVEVNHSKQLTFTVTPANLTGSLSIDCDNDKYTVSPTSIAQNAEGAQTITVTAAPTAWNDDMDGAITISGGGLASNKTVTLSANPYLVSTVTLSATNGVIQQGGVTKTSITSRVGNTVTLTAVPNSGYLFDGWTAENATPTSSNTVETEFTLSAATVTITANFVVDPCRYATLADEIPTPDANGSYSDDAIEITEDGFTWGFKGYAAKDLKTLQIRAKTAGGESYIKLPELPGNIQTISCSVTSGSGGSKGESGKKTTNTLYFQTGNTNDAKEVVGTSNNDESYSRIIDISSVLTKYNTGYITASGSIRIWDITVSYIPTAIVNLNAACNDGKGMYYGTYSNSSAFVVPSDLIVSTVGVSDGKLTVKNYSTGDVVKANTGVMISSDESGNHSITLSNETGTENDGNLLKPSGDAGIDKAAMAAAAPSCKYYRLTMHNETKIGFWWGAADGAAFALAANKAYLAVPVATARSGFNLFDDETTGIETVDVNAESANDAREYYNLNGQRVANPSKGLYIVNGKKVIIK